MQTVTSISDANRASALAPAIGSTAHSPNSAAPDGPGTTPCPVAAMVCTRHLIPVVALPDGYGLLPLTLSVAQVVSWTGLKKTKLQELINSCEITTAKVDNRTLILTGSVIALIQRNRVERNG